MSTGTKRIIESYLEHGGAAMDEPAYQAYRAAILSRWLETLTMVRVEEDPPLFYCSLRTCPDFFACMSIDDAIRHLKVHKPEWFQE